MGDMPEKNSAPVSSNPANVAAVVPATARYNSPSLSRAPLLATTLDVEAAASSNNNDGDGNNDGGKRSSSHDDDAWLPITESRKGNAFYAAFHVLCSGIAVQALIVPVAFTVLGWAWGIVSLVIAFVWQLYTVWLLVQLHESKETGMRYSRYLQLCSLTFGRKTGKLLALFPILYMSGGTCVALIILGGSTLKVFFRIACAETCTAHPLTPVEWFLVFSSAALALSLLPNLNSIAGVSLVGAVTGVGFCTLIWMVSLVKGRLPGVSYDNATNPGDNTERFFLILNALGMIVFAFRGHNLILEIQGTMPSTQKHPSSVPMWRGVSFAYTVIALCIFPLAIVGFWAYGQMIPREGGLLPAIYAFHARDLSRAVIGLMSLLIVANAASAFQIYAMQVFDMAEGMYTQRTRRPCSWWLRLIVRVLVVYGCFFVAVLIPFLGSLAGLIGGIALPVTFAYPCFMWIRIKNPRRCSAMWWLNWGLGHLGMALSALLIAAGIYVIANAHIDWDFFDPQF